MKEFAACFQKYYIFKERSPRQEFWFFCLFGGLILGIACVLDYFLATSVYFDGMFAGGYITWFSALVMLCPFCAVMTRRLHDTGCKEIWMILFFVINAITIPLIYESLTIYGSEGGRFIFALLLVCVFVSVFYNVWLIFTLCTDSVPDNKYGKNPKTLAKEENNKTEDTETKEETAENTEE